MLLAPTQLVYMCVEPSSLGARVRMLCVVAKYSFLGVCIEESGRQ